MSCREGRTSSAKLKESPARMLRRGKCGGRIALQPVANILRRSVVAARHADAQARSPYPRRKATLKPNDASPKARKACSEHPPRVQNRRLRTAYRRSAVAAPNMSRTACTRRARPETRGPAPQVPLTRPRALRQGEVSQCCENGQIRPR
jgi:hypothetical protein